MSESQMVFAAVLGLLGAGVSVLLIYAGSRPPRPKVISPSYFIPCEECGGEVRRGRRECPWCRAPLVRLELVPEAPVEGDVLEWERPSSSHRRRAA